MDSTPFSSGTKTTPTSGNGAGGSAIFAFAPIVPSEGTFLAITGFAAGARRTVTAAFAERLANTGAFATWAATLTAVAFGLQAFVAGEFFKTVGFSFALRPRGLEQIVQIKAKINNVAHVKKAPSKRG